MTFDGDRVTDSGIGVLGEVEWGHHATQFYNGGDDLPGQLASFFRPGLENHEMCVWITSGPLGPEDAHRAMEKSVPGFQEFLDSSQIEIINYDDWYLDDGSFRGKRVLDGWGEKYANALENGYGGMRISGDMSWVDEETWSSFAAYEKNVNGFIEGERILALCNYPLDYCERTQISDVVQNHRTSIWAAAESWDGSRWATGRIVDEFMNRKRMMRSLRTLPARSDFRKRFEKTSGKISESLEMKKKWEVRPALHRMNEVMGREIEGETGIKLSSLSRDRIDMGVFSEQLSRTHLEVLGPEDLELWTDGRSVTIKVVGCKYSDACGLATGDIMGCLPDRLAAAVLQAVTDTPVGLEVTRDEESCRRRFSPVWMVDFLSDLGEMGAESFVILYGDRLIHSEISSETDRRTLSEAILMNEESEEGDIPPQVLSEEDGGAAGALVVRLGGVFLALTLAKDRSRDGAMASISRALARHI